MKSSPEEAERFEIPRCFLDETLSCRTKFAQGRPTEFTFNLAEIEIFDWDDRQTETVIVRRPMAKQVVYHKVSPRLKTYFRHAVCLGCAREADADLIVSQDSTRVRDHLKKSGFCLGTDLILARPRGVLSVNRVNNSLPELAGKDSRRSSHRSG
jgi:hypothetical protein